MVILGLVVESAAILRNDLCLGLCVIPNYYNSIDLVMPFILKACNCKGV